ncbi:MAG: hypothetical protein Q8L27_02895 [archaeon]|nr:hypothetical protein [archaeon]
MKRGFSKKGAFEMSMSTIIIIVLSVSFLILGLVLLRSIFGVADDSITSISGKLNSELQKVFTDETKNLVIYSGTDRVVKVRAGTTNFGVLIASQTLNNIRIDTPDQVQYKFELVDDGSPSSCIKLLTKTRTLGLFRQQFDTWVDSYDADGPISRSILYVSIPSDTRTCTQSIRVTAIDKTAVTEGETIGFQTFTIEVLKKGLF